MNPPDASTDVESIALGGNDPQPQAERRSWLVVYGWRIAVLAVIQAYVVGSQLERIAGADRAPTAKVMSMPGMPDMVVPGAEPPSPWAHGLRNSTLALPLLLVVLLLIAVILRNTLGRGSRFTGGTFARILFAIGIALAALTFLLSDALSGVLFSEPLNGVRAFPHYLDLALVGLRYSFALGLLYAAFLGVPWTAARSHEQSR